MSMSVNLHGAIRAKAVDLGSASSLQIMDDDLCRVTIFMPVETARAMAEAFNAHQPKPAPQEAAE